MWDRLGPIDEMDNRAIPLIRNDFPFVDATWICEKCFDEAHQKELLRKQE
jgi:hypothetical protein